MTTSKEARYAAESIESAIYNGGWSRKQFSHIIQASIDEVDEKWRERFRKFEKVEKKFGKAPQRKFYE
jgi:hypothetical protein